MTRTWFVVAENGVEATDKPTAQVKGRVAHHSTSADNIREQVFCPVTSSLASTLSFNTSVLILGLPILLRIAQISACAFMSKKCCCSLFALGDGLLRKPLLCCGFLTDVATVYDVVSFVPRNAGYHCLNYNVPSRQWEWMFL